mgnify:FL=1
MVSRVGAHQWECELYVLGDKIYDVNCVLNLQSLPHSARTELNSQQPRVRRSLPNDGILVKEIS